MLAIGVMDRALATAPINADESSPLNLIDDPVSDSRRLIVIGPAACTGKQNTRSVVGGEREVTAGGPKALDGG